MKPNKRMQLLNVIGMVIMLSILVLSGIGQGTWNWCRITLFAIGLVGLILIVTNKIRQIMKK